MEMSVKNIKKRYEHPHVEVCRKYGGKGFNMIDKEPILMGKGEIVKENCVVCAGTGRVIISRMIETTVIPFEAGLSEM